jgi:hypothetical protein
MNVYECHAVHAMGEGGERDAWWYYEVLPVCHASPHATPHIPLPPLPTPPLPLPPLSPPSLRPGKTKQIRAQLSVAISDFYVNFPDLT